MNGSHRNMICVDDRFRRQRHVFDQGFRECHGRFTDFQQGNAFEKDEPLLRGDRVPSEHSSIT